MTEAEQQEDRIKINPDITQAFVRDVLEKKEKGIYRVEVRVGDKIIADKSQRAGGERNHRF